MASGDGLAGHDALHVVKFVSQESAYTVCSRVKKNSAAMRTLRTRNLLRTLRFSALNI
jgi:hypothetical protein